MTKNIISRLYDLHFKGIEMEIVYVGKNGDISLLNKTLQPPSMYWNLMSIYNYINSLKIR
jgi:hypothetical protein